MISVLETIKPPVTEPVSTNTAALHLRVDSDDPMIRVYVGAAANWVEGYVGRALVQQQLRWTIAASPPSGGWPMIGLSSTLLVLPQWLTIESLGVKPLRLPRQPVMSVDSVSIGRWGEPDTALDPGCYGINLATSQVHLFGARGLLAGAHASITFTAGYGAVVDTIPFAIRQAVLLLAAFLYEHRGDDDAQEPPAAVKLLLNPYRLVTFG